MSLSTRLRVSGNGLSSAARRETTPVSERGKKETKEGYYLEFRPMGGVIKVAAIDPKTGTEVSIVGDPGVSQQELTDVAIRKLRYVLAKRAGEKA